MSDSTSSLVQTHYEPVRIDWQPTPLGERRRFGLIALAADHASETELHRMMPPDDMDLYVTRIHHSGACNLESLRAMEGELVAAAALLLPGTPLDAVAFGCTSGTAAIGFAQVASAIRAQRPGVAVTTPITAAESACRVLRAGRIAVLTPYVDEVNEMIVAHLENAGIAVSRLASFGLSTDQQMSGIPGEAIERAVCELDLSTVEAVFICCTALRAVATIEPLERRLGLPVITSNQAMLWEMLQMADYNSAVAGYGRLLEGL